MNRKLSELLGKGGCKPAKRKRRDKHHERLVTALVDGLNEMDGVTAWRNDTGMMPIVKGQTFTGRYRPYGTRNVSDVLGRIAPHGRFLAIEAKTGRGTLSEGQAQFIAATISDGGVAFVVHWDYAKHPFGMCKIVRAATAAVEAARKEARP